MLLLRHIPFLKTVFIYSFTAFGGPQGHIGMMSKTFVQKRKDITDDELLEFNSFCQMLPGPSSTQTVMLIAMKRGGIPLACITLLLWVMPAAIIMGAFSFLLRYFDSKDIQTNLFEFIQPMSVGFVCFAAARMMKTTTQHIATTLIMMGGFLVTIAIRSPWVFPALLVISGTVSNFSNKRIPDSHEKPKRINWVNLWLFAFIFIGAGVLSELAISHHWAHGRVFNLFENFYRFGSIVFGGGQALLPMMLFQFANGRPGSITPDVLMTGYGMVQAVPGPVFSVCSFVGGMVMSQYGTFWQIVGCFTAIIAVFLPSTLLLFFFFPIFQNLKHHVIIYRALEGINAVVVGIIWASGILLFQAISPLKISHILYLNPNISILHTISPYSFEWSNLVVAIITFCLLYFTKIPAPLIVLAWLLLGWTLH